jgi:hypothetical protein
MVRRLAKVAADRRTGHSLEVAPLGRAGLLALALKTGKQGGSPSDNAGVSRSHSTHGDRESFVGSTADPSRAGKAWLPGLGPKHCKIHAAASVGWGAVSGLARVPEATRIDYLGLRLPLRADDLLSNTLRVLRGRSRQPGSSPRRDNAASDGGVGKPTDRRMLRLGSRATALSHPRS